MNPAATFRLCYRDSVYKRAAEDFGVTVEAVRWWIRNGIFPRGREAQVRAVVERRLAEQATEIAETLRLIRRGFDEASSARAGAAAVATRRRAQPMGSPPRGSG